MSSNIIDLAEARPAREHISENYFFNLGRYYGLVAAQRLDAKGQPKPPKNAGRPREQSSEIDAIKRQLAAYDRLRAGELAEPVFDEFYQATMDICSIRARASAAE